MREASGGDPRGGTVFRECEWCPELVVVPAGRFRMGCVSGHDCGRGLPDLNVIGREWPVHEVEVSSFALGVYEVTVEEFDRFVTATGAFSLHYSVRRDKAPFLSGCESRPAT